MLKIGTSDSSPLILTPELTSPALYLDYCVIGDLARNPALGGRLRDCLLEKKVRSTCLGRTWWSCLRLVLDLHTTLFALILLRSVGVLS